VVGAMKNNSNKQTKVYQKIRNLNHSITKMMDCVKHLEKMRSLNYLMTLDEEELAKVMEHMQEIEESIEKINCSTQTASESGVMLKAIGKDRKFWVSKPGAKNCNDITEKKSQKGYTTNPISDSQEEESRTAETKQKAKFNHLSLRNH
jgi:hypothetical protein